jgi:protein-serine/threonine kinase
MLCCALTTFSRRNRNPAPASISASLGLRQDMASTKTSPSTNPSQPSSVKSLEVPSLSPKLQNGTANSVDSSAPTVVESLKPLPEKTSVKNRLTRMFSSKDVSRNATPDVTGAPNKKDRAGSVTALLTGTPGKPEPPTRKGSTTEKIPEKGVLTTVAKKDKTLNGNQNANRYTVVVEAQGGHEHFLKSSRRQEKLTDMFRGLLGKKSENPDNDLSLVSSWVDTLKNESDKDVAGDKKGGPNTVETLTEKYGKCQEVVGRGAFGIVRISHKKMENGGGEKLFAVKEFRRRPEETEKKYGKRLTAEFCISSSLRHPNVIHTLDLLKDAKGDYCEVMEFCAGGDLYTLVLSAGKLEVQEADCFFKQMMRGVQYMHEMGVAHRDLKPENLLLTTRGALKITDFGNGECFRMAWETDPHMVSGLCGSAPYIAPEEYTDKEFDARALDVWACGVIYMAMRTGRHLWRVAKKDEDEFYARYLEGRRDEEGYGPIESLHRVSIRPTPL